jgi:hypothetical protein
VEEDFKMQKPMKNDRYFVAAAWVVLGVVARLIPHPANVTPMTAISTFGGAQLGKLAGLALTLATLAISDILLSFVYGHQAFGLWSLFTYTGFAAIVLAGSLLRHHQTALRTLGLILGSSLGFWVWTNFGTWLTGGLYPLTGEGLLACYGAALPFLRNALLGDLAWGAAFFLSFQGVRQLAPRYGWNVQGA